MHVIGIDLGTTNSCVSVIEGTDVTVIPNRDGQLTTPSVVAIADDGTVSVGGTAKRHIAVQPARSFFAFKRLIGQRFAAAEVQALRQTLSYGTAAASNGDVVVKLGETTLHPQEVAAHLLDYLRSCAEQYLGASVHDAVITVPAYFNDNQRQATRNAATIAGLNVRRIINEPTAAALAYGAGKELAGVNWVVFDLGGGTFDVSVLSCDTGVFEVLATAGDSYLGGVDFDNVLLRHVTERFIQDTGVDVSKDPVCIHRIREEVELARCSLSTCHEVTINVPYLTVSSKGPLHLTHSLTRQQLNELTQPLLNRLAAPVRDALANAGLSSRAIDGVLVVGGMTRTPAVCQVIADLFGKEPLARVNPDQIVAMGAAWQAAQLNGSVDEVLLLDVTPHSLGIAAVGGRFSCLIPRNRTIPTEQDKLFATTEDNQTFVNIDVYQGEADRVDDNTLLGRLVLTGLPLGPAGSVRVNVTFTIDANGIVTVKARDEATANETQMTVRAKTGLPAQEVQRLAGIRRSLRAGLTET